MKKKSGLADSPFFKSTSTTNVSVSDNFAPPSQPLQEQIIFPQEKYEENPGLARNQAIGQAILPECPNAGMPEIRQSGKTESPIDRKPDIMNAGSLAESVQAALKTKAEKKESFRFPLELTEELIDIPHEVRKTHRKPLSKTAIFVAALTSYLWDFRQHGKESLLYKQLIEENS